MVTRRANTIQRLTTLYINTIKKTWPAFIGKQDTIGKIVENIKSYSDARYLDMKLCNGIAVVEYQIFFFNFGQPCRYPS